MVLSHLSDLSVVVGIFTSLSRAKDRSFRIFVSSNTLRSVMKPFTLNVAVGWTAFIYREQAYLRMKR